MSKDEIVYSYSLGDKPEKYDDNKKNDKTKKNFVPDDFIRMSIEKNHRGGKTVTVIYGFKDEIDINEICKELKKKCGSGGTVKEKRIEIQGDKRDIVEKYLNLKNFKVKRSGG